MELTILIATRKFRPLGKLKLKSRIVKTLPDQMTKVAISPVAASQFTVSRAASDNTLARNSHDLTTRNYNPCPSLCSANSR